MKGNPEAVQDLFSHREDVTLANPRGGVASSRRDGQTIGFEIEAKHVTPELAYVVEVEGLEAKSGGREEIAPYDLRVTMIFRPEDGVWKVVHRHADSLTTAQPAAQYE